MNRIRLLLLAASLLGGCAAGFTRTGPVLPALPPEAPVNVVLDGQPLPQRYVVLGYVEAKSSRGVLQMLEKLKAHARKLGADAVIAVKQSQSYEAWANNYGAGVVPVYHALATAVCSRPECDALSAAR